MILAIEGAHGDGEIAEECEADQREAEVVAARGKRVTEFVVRNESREVVKSRNSKESFQNLQREGDAVLRAMATSRRKKASTFRNKRCEFMRTLGQRAGRSQPLQRLFERGRAVAARRPRGESHPSIRPLSAQDDAVRQLPDFRQSMGSEQDGSAVAFDQLRSFRNLRNSAAAIGSRLRVGSSSRSTLGR